MAAVTAIGSNTNGNVLDPLNLNKNTTTGSSSSGSSTSSTGSTSSLASESTFLTLLVAQLQNQDPSQPADGMQFVTQLAQFTTLEQNLAMRTDLDSINSKVPAATTPTTPATTATDGTQPIGS